MAMADGYATVGRAWPPRRDRRSTDTSMRLVDRLEVVGGRPWPVEIHGRETSVDVSLVIPCRNEARNLPSVLAQIPSTISEVVIVDGHSTDDTIEVVREFVPDAVVVEQVGRGKGDALRAGFTAASGEIIVMLDADGSMSPREIAPMVNALAGGADVVKGSRFLPGGGSADLTILRNAGNLALNWVFNLLYRSEQTDLCYGYMAFWARHLDVLMPDCDGFEVETLVCPRASRGNLRVVEVPSHEGRRIYGESNLRTFRDGFRVLRTLLAERRPKTTALDQRLAPFVGNRRTVVWPDRT